MKRNKGILARVDSQQADEVLEEVARSK